MVGYLQTRKILRSLLCALLALALVAPAASAASGPRAQALPPLPEWPIVGPILRMLGLVQAEPAPAVAPDPTIPEYRITSIADAEALPEFAEGERVRIVASDSDLNTIIEQTLQDNLGDGAAVAVDFDTGVVHVVIDANEELLDQAGADIPRFGNADLHLTASMTIDASDCQPTIGFSSISVNRWRIGLRVAAQRVVNTRLPEMWPQELCLERVFLMDGEAAVEGYRR